MIFNRSVWVGFHNATWLSSEMLKHLFLHFFADFVCFRNAINHVCLSWKSINLWLQLRNDSIFDNLILELVSHRINSFLSVFVTNCQDFFRIGNIDRWLFFFRKRYYLSSRVVLYPGIVLNQSWVLNSWGS